MDDFGDVDRRKQNLPPPNGKEKRSDSMSHEEHHKVCLENVSIMKEYICLKLKPIIANQEFLKKWLFYIVMMLAAGGMWGGINSYANSSQNTEIEHIKKDHANLKQDLVKRIDKLEKNTDEKFREYRDETKEDVQSILKAIENFHK